MIERKQIDIEIQTVTVNDVASQINGDIKKFRTEPKREMQRVAPKAKANSLPLK